MKLKVLLFFLLFGCFSLSLHAAFPRIGVGDAAPDNGWKEQIVVKHNGWDDKTELKAKRRILSENWKGFASCPGVVFMPDKNRLLLLMTNCGYPYRSMMMESDDFGETWTKPHFINDEKGNPEVNGIGMCYLGNGKLMFYRGNSRTFSEDYGETWKIVNQQEAPSGEPAIYSWDPPLLVRDGDKTTLYETAYYARGRAPDGGHHLGYHSQAYIRSSEDEGLTWSEPIKVPQWDHINEVFPAQAPNGDLVGACRTDNQSWWLDYVSGLVTCVSSDGGKTWSEPFVVLEAGGHHPSIVNLPDGRMVMTYVIRTGYPNDENGRPQFGVEAVVSNDNGKTWDIDGRYILATLVGKKERGEDWWYNAPQSSSSVLLPDGRIFTTFGTGDREYVLTEDDQPANVFKWAIRDTEIMIWSPLPKTEPTPRQKAMSLVRKFQLDRPFWKFDARTVYGESLMFIQDEGKAPIAKTLFVPSAYRRIVSSGRETAYFENVDYIVHADDQTIELTPQSAIPFFKRSDLFPPSGSPHSIAHRTNHPEQGILLHDDAFFHNHQVLIDYVPLSRDTMTPGVVAARADAADHWKGYVPQYAGAILPKTMAKLKSGKPITLCVSGDSISHGYDASAFETLQVEPFQPSYSELVAMGLEARYGSPVTWRNFAVAGWKASDGVADLPRVLEAKPDLLIIAYGMNDVSSKNPKQYRDNLKTIIDTVRGKLPDCEFILASTMLGNSEWIHTPEEFFPAYREAVESLRKEYPSGVAFADVTAMWTDILKRKSFYDLVGNGLNHPNDFGHRIYAQVTLGLMFE